MTCHHRLFLASYSLGSMSLRSQNVRLRTKFRVLFSCPTLRPVHRNNATRNASTTAQSPDIHRGSAQGQSVRVSTVFQTLIALGIGTTAYGLYDFYNAVTLWPSEVRSDLRAGLKARNQGDLGLSERYLRRAYQTALDLPASMFEPSPYLKLTGIAIALASVLEANNQPKAAWDIYLQALSLPQSSFFSSPAAQSDTSASSIKPPQLEQRRLTPQDTLRQVSIAHKLGEMAETYKFGDEVEEKWLSWGVERLLGLVKEEGVAFHSGKIAQGQEQENKDEGMSVILADLDLPGWVTKTDICAPLEALGAFYAHRGKVEYAMPLYLQAISLLMPSSPEQPSSLEDRCRGAQIMNNISSLIMSKPPTPATLTQAESWARKSAAVCGQEINSPKLKKGDKDQLRVCETTLAVALFNMASLREMADDRAAAKELFSNSLDQSRRMKLREGIVEAQTALRRLDRADRKSA